MSRGQWLIEWWRVGDDEWACLGLLDPCLGFVIIGSKKFRVPVVMHCDRTTQVAVLRRKPVDKDGK